MIHLILLVGLLLGDCAKQEVAQRHHVTRAIAERVQKGMTLEDVERIFGSPGQPWSGGFTSAVHFGSFIWIGETGYARVGFVAVEDSSWQVSNAASWIEWPGPTGIGD